VLRDGGLSGRCMQTCCRHDAKKVAHAGIADDPLLIRMAVTFLLVAAVSVARTVIAGHLRQRQNVAEERRRRAQSVESEVIS